MSLESFLSLLLTADEIDKRSAPVRVHGLRRAGIACTVLGLLGYIAAEILGNGCAAVIAGLVLFGGLICILLYTLGAKQYGYAAVVCILLALGACGGIAAIAAS